MTPEQKLQVEQFNKERNAALILGVEAMKEFYRKENRGKPEPASELVWEIMYHKCVTAVEAMPPELRATSKKWLKDRNYQSWE